MQTCASCVYHTTVERQRPIYPRIPGSGMMTVEIPVCRRYPQHVERAPEDWCGEHKEKVV